MSDGCRSFPRPTNHHDNSWRVIQAEDEVFLFRTVTIEALPIDHQRIRRQYTFFSWRDSDYITKYVDADMKFEFDLIRKRIEKRDNLLAINGGSRSS